MKMRNTLILMTIAAALLAFVLLYERKQPVSDIDEATPPPTELPVILYFDENQAQALRVTQPGTGQSTELARDAQGQWRLTAPIAELADQDQVGYVLGALAFLQPSREITGFVSLADYGLDQPQLEVTIELADGTTHTIRFGETNPTRSAYYAQVDGQESVFLVDSYTGAQLQGLLDNPPVQPTPTAPPAGTPMAEITSTSPASP